MIKGFYKFINEEYHIIDLIEFRPSEEQMEMLQNDVAYKLGIDDHVMIIKLEYYSTDGDPRYYAILDIYDDNSKIGQKYVDIYVDILNASNNSAENIGIEHVEEVNHGTPATGITIAKWNYKTDSFDIKN